MMPPKILLTSFRTWLPHQKSNSSDDLLDLVNLAQKEKSKLDSIFFLRQLPVDVELATKQIIEAIKVVNPQGIICCGMAESRNELALESNASCNQERIFTQVDLDELASCLINTKISHDAGKFVCEGLYYQLLKYLQVNNFHLPCMFVHVPILLPSNLEQINQDFKTIIRYTQSIAAYNQPQFPKRDN